MLVTIKIDIPPAINFFSVVLQIELAVNLPHALMAKIFNDDEYLPMHFESWDAVDIFLYMYNL